MRSVTDSQTDEHQRPARLILDAIADGTVLVGTMTSLSHALGIKITELRSILRELLEAGAVAISTEARGQLTIRLERRRPETLQDRRAAPERRRPKPDVWML